MRRSRFFITVVLLAGCYSPVAEKQCDDLTPCGSGWRCVAGECAPPFSGGSGGGAGGGGGGTGGGSTVCGGCRDAAGMCWPGGSEAHCGDVGRICQTCSASQKCVNGLCLNPMCTPANCAGCCVGTTCVLPPNQSASNCGLGGKTCAGCASGNVCRNGACVAPCNATTCFNGCCDPAGQCVITQVQNEARCGSFGAACVACPVGIACQAGVCGSTTCAGCLTPFNLMCVPGTVDGQCGRGGQICTPCGAGQRCLGQACLPLATKIGDACGSDPDCQGVGAGIVCKVKTTNGTEYPAGYCTRGCAEAGPPCPSGALCTNGVAIGGEAQSFCGAACSDAGMCRPGYACRSLSVGSSICFMPSRDGGL